MSMLDSTKRTDTRQVRGLEIASRFKITQTLKGWIVPSQSGKGLYTVSTSLRYCTCPDFEIRRTPCKHIYAVEHQQKQATETPPVASVEPVEPPKEDKPKAPRKPTYKQNWPAYNAAQTNEKAKLMDLLYDLCNGIQEPDQGFGRPRLPMSDRVFALAFKVYVTFSARRFMSDLYDAWAKEYITRVPHYNSVIRYFEMPELTPILQALIVQSSLPLKAVESDFALDSSGFSTSQYVKWFNQKYGKEHEARHWLKAHLMCGVKTNIITSVEITGGFVHDSNMLPTLVQATARNFTMREVSADKGYPSRANLEAIAATGALPFIPFREGTGGLGDGSTAWDKLYHFYSFNRDVFLQHYHKRSNVESTFSMLKAKFGAHLRSKSEAAQINELLCKVLCHNICVLIQSMYELGVAPKFWKD